MQTRLFIVLLCLLVFVAGVSAQEMAPSYRLDVEDAVTISVLKHAEYSGDFLVAPDGTIDIPGAGKVVATGKTLAELQADIVTRLSDRLRMPEVTVTLRQPREQRVYVLGMVRHPGVFDLKARWRITEALTEAGGLLSGPLQSTGIITPQVEDCTVTLLRAANGEQTTFKLVDVMAEKVAANPLLQPGDVLTVNVLQTLPVYVMGAVKNPGEQEMRPGQSVVEALALAGGLLYPQEDVKMTLLRAHEAKTVYLTDKIPSEMERGDVLMIEPLRELHVTVAGQVAKPGIYDLKEGEGVLSAITQAGGATDMASLAHVKVVHEAGSSEFVDMTSAYLKGGEEQKVALGSGDLVIVPQNTNAVAVTGYVKQPGFFPLKEGKSWTLAEMIGIAGGVQDKRVGMAHVAILRTDAGGKQTRIIVDLNKYYKDGDLRSNPIMQPGDVVYVPETKNPDLSIVFQALTSLGLVGDWLK